MKGRPQPGGRGGRGARRPGERSGGTPVEDPVSSRLNSRGDSWRFGPIRLEVRYLAGSGVGEGRMEKKRLSNIDQNLYRERQMTQIREIYVED